MNHGDSSELLLDEAFVSLAESSSYVADSSGAAAIGIETDLRGRGFLLHNSDSPDRGLLPAGHDFHDVAPLGFWDLVDWVSHAGFTSIRVVGDNDLDLVGRFAVTPEDLTADRPSTIVVSDNEGYLFSFDRTGQIDETEMLFEWLRFDRIDCDAAGDPTQTEDRVPFPWRTHGEAFWELIGPSGERPMIQELSEIGVWMPPEGAFVAFTSRDDAERADAALPIRRIVGAHGRPVPRETGLEPRRIPSLRAWVKRVWLLNQLRPTRFAIDPHRARDAVGLGDPALGPFVRTTQGWWEIQDDDDVLLDHVCHERGEDTIHWDGSHAWPVQPPETSFGQPVCGQLCELRLMTERERVRAVKAGRVRRGVPPGDLADSYLIVTTDRLTGETVFRFFEDQLAGVSWLADYESSTDLPWRLSGRHIDAERFTDPTTDASGTSRMSVACGVAVESLIRSALLESLDSDFDKRVSALANRVCGQLRVEVCGLSADVAQGVRDLAERADMLAAALGSDWPAVRKRLVLSGAYELDPASSERCRTGLGDEAFRALSPEAGWFLGAGLAQMTIAASQPDADQAGSTLELARALEFELQLLFVAARRALIVRGVLATDSDQSPLARFMGGGTPLTLGQVLYYVRREDDPSTSLWREFRSVIVDELGVDIVFSKSWWKGLKSLTNGIRNRAGHTDPITRADAMRAFDLVVGTRKAPGLLPMLVCSWKSDEQSDFGPNAIGGRRSIEVDHIAVRFDRAEEAAQRADSGYVLEKFAGVSEPLLETVEGLTLFEHVAEGFIVAKPEHGPLLIVSIPMRDGAVVLDGTGVADVVHRIWSQERLSDLQMAFARRVVRWSRQGDEIFTTSDGGLSIRFRLDSGAHQLKSLSPKEADEFRRLTDELAAERFGPILSRSSDPVATIFAAIEEQWAVRERERAVRRDAE